MADDEPQFTSVAERIAALKLQNAGGSIPLQQAQGYSKIPNGANPRPRPPPPPRPSVPARPNRSQTSSVPPANDNGPSSNRPVGNVPDAGRPDVFAVNGVNSVPARPSQPVKTATQPSRPPALPARTPSGPSPALPPRRPSEAPPQPEYVLSRRGSTDSTSSVATARSSVSAISNATSYTSVGGERYKIRAPDFDPSSLPVLPPKRSKEEREAADKKYNGTRPMRRTASTPRVAQIQEGTTPPPLPIKQTISQPTLPERTDSVPKMPHSTQEVGRSIRAQPPPPPARASQPPLPARTALQTKTDIASRPQLAAPPKPRVSALSLGFGNKATSATSPVSSARLDGTLSSSTPPPIPAASKPNLAALQASKPRPNAAGVAPESAPVNGAVAITSYAQFSQILSSHCIVVSDFWAPWCGPCRNFAPDYERLAREYSRSNQIAFVKINTDDNKDIAQAFKIECWPTLIMFENGTEVDKSLGASEYWLTSLVEDLARKARIDLSAPVAASAPPPPSLSNSCLHCRDFSGPDNHAARFPRQSIPSHDVGWLAAQLTSPFPSRTDKARAIFTWLHHNVAYNTQAFFSNNVKGSTPQSTLQTGLAVCEGYAGLFAALAVKAGMESVVITGASKGFGYTPLQAGQPIPPYKSDHAWNVVKIDGGEWKLLDSCWGAGNVNGGTQSYEKHFKPDWFTMSNNEFGLSHYPESSYQQYRTDGRALSWEEFSMANKDGTGALVYNKATEEGIAKTSLCPVDGKINLAQQGPTVRFSFQKICPHWDPIKNGPGAPYLFVLLIDAQKDDREKNCPPFDTNGEVWWCDVPTHHLGRSGQKIMLIGLTEFGGRNGRGLTIREFQSKKGRSGWASAGIAQWEIA